MRSKWRERGEYGSRCSVAVAHSQKRITSNVAGPGNPDRGREQESPDGQLGVSLPCRQRMTRRLLSLPQVPRAVGVIPDWTGANCSLWCSGKDYWRPSESGEITREPMRSQRANGVLRRIVIRNEENRPCHFLYPAPNRAARWQRTGNSSPDNRARRRCTERMSSGRRGTALAANQISWIVAGRGD